MENKVFIKLLEWSFAAILAIVIALAVRYYVIAPAAVVQNSMSPTLQQGQRIILNRLSRVFDVQYERGDIVTFEAPIMSRREFSSTSSVAMYNDEPANLLEKLLYNVLEFNKTSYIKRIVGVAGDTVHIQQDGIYVNGEKIINTEYDITADVVFNDICVPDGHVYVIGDNVTQSLDSRYFGCIPIKKIEGKVIYRYWPYSDIGKVN